MAEQIILNTDLYDNLLTERKGDYTAKPRITGTLYNTDIAARIVAARTEYQHGTILNILDMADSHKVQAIAEGKSVVDGVGQYLDRKSTRLNSSHDRQSRMPSSA